MITVTPSIALDESEIEEHFIRASGPGGQNINKVATAVQLRFDVRRSPSLPEPVRQRLMHIGRGRITTEGILVIDARRFRTQVRNREDALYRLTELIREAAQTPKSRRQTKPTPASQRRRLESKKQRGGIKRLRGPVAGLEH
jgi:ribosome-associated protein